MEEIDKVINSIIIIILIVKFFEVLAIVMLILFGDCLKMIFESKRLPKQICTKYITEITAVGKKKEFRNNSVKYVIKITARTINKKKPHWICGEMEVDEECFERTELKRSVWLGDIEYFVNINTIQQNINHISYHS